MCTNNVESAAYSPNAAEALGNKLVRDLNASYFSQLWGRENGEEETLSRALILVELMTGNGNDLGRIKHTYQKPGMFGWEAEEGKDLQWISYRGFISRVVRKESAGSEGGESSGPCVEIYKNIVSYLMRECGVSRSYFDPAYSDFASFGKTFDKMWENLDPEVKGLGRSVGDMKAELAELEASFQRMAYLDITGQILDCGLLREPSKYFDKDQCDSLAKMNSDVFSGRLKIEYSTLGEDIKREISKRRLSSR